MIKNIVIISFALALVIIALASVGPIIGLIVSVLIGYFSFKQFLATQSAAEKIIWGLIVLLCLSSIFKNIPALAGILAIVILYVGYKKWADLNN